MSAELRLWRQRKKARIVVIWCQKGGCGKSTITYHMLFEFIRRGLRVLFIDQDPQNQHAANWFMDKGQIASNRHIRNAYTTYSIRESITQVTYQGMSFDMIQSDYDMCDLANSLAMHRLGELLVQVEDDYDVILIDQPSDLNDYVRNAMYTADTVIVPGVCDDVGGVSGCQWSLDRSIREIPTLFRDKENKRWRILLNKCDGLNETQELIATYFQFFGPAMIVDLKLENAVGLSTSKRYIQARNQHRLLRDNRDEKRFIEEIEALVNYVEDEFDKLPPRLETIKAEQVKGHSRG